LRITIGTDAQSVLLLKALREILSRPWCCLN
jgi:histidinol-phosphate/aromatic aminotransferase/cobyric acid decarboxylase-like protein